MTRTRWSSTLLLTAAVLGAALVGATVVTAAASPPPAAAADGSPGWMATLAVRGDEPLETRASCGGALVAPDKVLTAAHCLAGVPVEQLRGVAEYHLGAGTLSRDPGRTAGIADVALDPGYRLLPSPAAPDDPAASSATHDLAMVTLDRPVTGLPTLPLTPRTLRTGTVTTLLGHGITGEGQGQSDPLKVMGFRLAPLGTCVRATPAVVDGSSVLCGTSRGLPRPCTGDSGGPLVARDVHGRDVLVGIFSFGMETAGRPCGAPGPSVLGDVAAARPWIDAQLA